jgi:hypothetical protein
VNFVTQLSLKILKTLDLYLHLFIYQLDISQHPITYILLHVLYVQLTFGLSKRTRREDKVTYIICRFLKSQNYNMHQKVSTSMHKKFLSTSN